MYIHLLLVMWWLVRDSHWDIANELVSNIFSLVPKVYLTMINDEHSSRKGILLIS